MNDFIVVEIWLQRRPLRFSGIDSPAPLVRVGPHPPHDNGEGKTTQQSVRSYKLTKRAVRGVHPERLVWFIPQPQPSAGQK